MGRGWCDPGSDVRRSVGRPVRRPSGNIGAFTTLTTRVPVCHRSGKSGERHGPKTGRGGVCEACAALDAAAEVERRRAAESGVAW